MVYGLRRRLGSPDLRVIRGAAILANNPVEGEAMP